MSKILATSDWHFFHKRMIEGGWRIDNYMEVLITNYTEQVTEDDTVYFLGDMLFQPNKYKAVFASIMKGLPGKKYLIPGNHDDKKRFPKEFWEGECGIEYINNEFLWVDNNLLSHFPLVDTDGRYPEINKRLHTEFYSNPLRKKNYHGHVHSQIVELNDCVCACPEQTDYRLIELV